MVKQILSKTVRSAFGLAARKSPIKTNRFGYPNHIFETVQWLESEFEGKMPSYVQSVKFLPERGIRTVNPSKRIRESDPLLWEWAQNWKPRRRYVVTLNHVRVSGNAVIGPDHAILWQLSYLWNVSPAQHPLLKYPVLPSAVHLPGKSLFLSVDSADNYFHWLLDLLQKLKVLKDCGIDHLSFDHYLVNSQAKEFQRESLKRFGIPGHKIVETGRFLNLSTDILTVPSWAEQSGIFEPEDVQWVRTILMQPEQGRPTEQPKRFFISRKRTRGRNIINFSELETALQKHDVAGVELETLSFSEQIRLFRDANLVVGAHGAGLTNLLFCQPGTKVLELVNHHYACQMYYYLAAVLGLDHHYLVGKTAGSADPVFQDLTLDIGEIRRTLDLWQAGSVPEKKNETAD